VSLLLIAGALAGAGVFAGLRSRAGAPVTPPSIVGVRDEAVAAGSRPVVEPLQSFVVSPGGAGAPATAPAVAVTAAPEVAAPAAVVMPAPAPALVPATTAAPAPESPSPAAAWPAVRRSPPVPVRVVKKAVRKATIAHHAPAAAKPAPAARPAERSEARAEPRAEPRPPGSPLVRPGWRDPFGDR
jgi:hypothetical protein